MPQQADWRFCQKCQAMFFDGFTDKGDCPVGGGHLAQGYNFNLSYDLAESASAQAAWRYCKKCHVMFYDGFPDKGHCAAGGGHEADGYNFTLTHDVAVGANAQGSWRYCQDCRAMFYNGFTAKGLCPGHSALGTIPGRTPDRGHVASGFNFVLPYNAQPATTSNAPTFSLTGPVWVVGLNHQQSEDIQGSLAALGGSINALVAGGAIVLPVPVGVFVGAVGAAVGIIKLMDAIGGDQGVDVQGVIGLNGVIVTPHASGIIGTLVQGARVGVAGATIVDFILNAASKAPDVANALGIGTAAQVFSRVMGGMPFDWALAAAFGAIVNLLEPAPDPNAHGGIHADRPKAEDWERFIMAQIPPGNQIALLSWQGLFSAQNGGGGDVYANRSTVGPWETWNIVDNHDGTVSFQTTNGHYLTATNGGGNGSCCLANQTAIGTFERFDIENVAGGHIAIKTHDKGTYLSVQPGK